jgi:glutamine amidotransferase
VTPRVAVCDYGVGNLHSVERALARGGARVELTRRPDVIAGADGIVLPGVGAFGAAASALHGEGLATAIHEAAARGRPVLGVCLGLQLLFEWSEESPGAAGLGLCRGGVRRMTPSVGKVPHMGWNRLHMRRRSGLLDGLGEETFVYFVHSYVVHAQADGVVADCDHGGRFPAAVEAGAVMGTQFHPEKSGAAGLRVYGNFVGMCE